MVKEGSLDPQADVVAGGGVLLGGGRRLLGQRPVCQGLDQGLLIGGLRSLTGGFRTPWIDLLWNLPPMRQPNTVS